VPQRKFTVLLIASAEAFAAAALWAAGA